MKIQSNNEIMKNVHPDRPNKNEVSPSTDFKAVLKETVENSSKAGSNTKAPSLTDPVSAIHLKPVSRPAKSSTVDRVENFLNLLEDYRQKLADPQVTLRNIDPLIHNLAEKNRQLVSELDALPNGDELKDILNQTLVTATLEIIKFNRGDYITS